MWRFNLNFMSRILTVFFIAFSAIAANAQSSFFTFQGKLTDNSAAANGPYEMRFGLFDAGGTQIGANVTNNNVPVSNGIFTVQLNFGNSAFDGNPRFLEIAVRPAGSQNPFTILAPRQAVLSAPYAIKSLDATTATTAINSMQLGGVAANQYVVTTDARMSDARDPLAGSGNYVQNTTVQQSSSNFNISGEGRADILTAATQFNISANRVLTANSTRSTFAGFGAGQANTTSDGNSFFGKDSGSSNTTGSFNSFFGLEAGLSNTTGIWNSFFGAQSGRVNSTGSFNSFYGFSAGNANTTGFNNSFFGQGAGFKTTTGQDNTFLGNGAGQNNTTASGNSFVGSLSGFSNTTGNNNSFFGLNAGLKNTTGSFNTFAGTFSGLENTTGGSNSFFGLDAGRHNTAGNNNSFFGDVAGRENTTGNDNSFFGTSSGNANTSGDGNAFFGKSAGINNSSGAANTFIGAGAGLANTIGGNNSILGNNANLGANNLIFATAIGSGAIVSTSNTLVLGRAADTVQVPGLLNVAGTFGANIFNAVTQYNLGGNRILSAGGTNNIFAGNGAGAANTTGQANAFFGFSAGSVNTSGSFNAFFGSNAGAANTSAINNSFFGQGAGFKTTTGANNTFIGNGAGLNNLIGAGNTLVGSLAGQSTTGSNNTFFGVNAGTANVGNGNNTFIGANSANSNLTGSGNTFLGANTDGAFLTTNATALGQNAFAGQSNSLILGSINGINGATADTFVGIGTTTPQTKLYVKDNADISLTIESSNAAGSGIELVSTNGAATNWRMGAVNNLLTFTNSSSSGDLLRLNPAGGNLNGTVTVLGDLRVNSTIFLGPLSGSGSTNLCLGSGLSIAFCSSSRRYKKDIEPFKSGLSLINQLNPVTFRWKSDNMPDLGFVAEDVAEVEPLLTTTNPGGQIEGVKYDRISAVLVNAVKEQQAQIEQQEKKTEQQQAINENLQTRVREQQQTIEELKTIVCSLKPDAAICRQENK